MVRLRFEGVRVDMKPSNILKVLEIWGEVVGFQVRYRWVYGADGEHGYKICGVEGIGFVQYRYPDAATRAFRECRIRIPADPEHGLREEEFRLSYTTYEWDVMAYAAINRRQETAFQARVSYTDPQIVKENTFGFENLIFDTLVQPDPNVTRAIAPPYEPWDENK